ncbi:histidine kinase [Kitasatospora sp. NPDC093806]|uniref:sensor histidine kinase n=1 Tax=Kitasatospora sp. NPDC093806 TaxID=3155075 RepID=UPI00344AEA67
MTTPQDRPRGLLNLNSVRLQDTALALAAVIPELFYFGTIISPRSDGAQRLGMVLLTLAEAVALVLRRRRPVATFAAVWLITTAANVMAVAGVFKFTPAFGLLIALYTVAAQCRRPVALAALVLAFAPMGVTVYHDAYTYHGPFVVPVLVANIAFFLPVTVVVWGFARWSRAARADAERRRQEVAEARRRVTQERLRIARELHDIVANAVAVMVMRAETGRITALTDPAQGEAFGHIEDLGRSTLAELRHLLRLLRTSETPVEEGYGHGLGDLEQLLADVRRAGVEISLETSGTPLRIDDSVGRTAYRLVQEAATNITKHSGPGTSAVVRITWDNALLIEVVDDGAGRPPGGEQDLSTGHGLLGLRERVALFGGLLSAAPYGPGFRVAAALPVSTVPGHRTPDAHPAA